MRTLEFAAPLLLLVVSSVCMAQDEWTPLPATALEETRGGFSTPAGLSLSIGVERLVSVNGEVIARNSVTLSGSEAGLRTIDANGSGAPQLPVVIQNGAGNRFEAAMDAAPGAIVIQNTLNDQAIRSETVINATVNSMSLIKAMNFDESLGQALSGALPRQ